MKKTIISSLLAVAALAPVASFAADGTINFTGTVTDQTCTITGDNGTNYTVNLPKVGASSLASAGNKAGATPFSIKLSNCSTSATGARANFEIGANVDTSSGYLKNTSTGSTAATNVQIGLAAQDGTEIKLNATQPTTFFPITNKAANLTYLAQYVANGGAAGAGAVTTNVQYTIVYQ